MANRILAAAIFLAGAFVAAMAVQINHEAWVRRGEQDDLRERLERLERQVERLDGRLAGR